jgi:hypothetical protein
VQDREVRLRVIANPEAEQALKMTNAWLAQYFKIARVALRDKPQLLEKIGVSAPNKKAKPQAKVKQA